MQDLSPRKPPQLNIRAEDTSPAGENGALVWSTSEGRLINYNENAERWGVVGAFSALTSVTIPNVAYNSFVDLINIGQAGLTGNIQYFVPFYLTESRSITTIGYEVTTAASSGNASVGIYNTQVVNGISMPYQLLTSATGMNITTTGIKTATISQSITLQVGVLYWASILVTANVTIRASVPPTRMIFGASLTSVLVTIRLSNATGNLVNPAPTWGYSPLTLAPIVVYT